MIFAARDLGFSPEAEFRDRTQMQFIALLMRQGASRLILKGGMAMRALYGSTRLTKDVDFDCEDNVSQQSMQSHMSKALTQAARLAGLAGVEVTQTKRGERSARWRVMGTAAGDVKIIWEVEVSRRGVPPPEFIETKPFETPVAYRISPFSVRVYGPAAMAGGKVNALLRENRSVPRDVYDLSELIRHGADPTELWIRRIPRQVLERKRTVIMAKIEIIDFAMSAAELLPYVAPEIRQSIDEPRWDEIRLDVAHHVERWMDSAIARTKTSGNDDHAQNTDIDLAGR
ncbi:MAG: nucleotidyl transferase AbiEii/AbiGii toxin family protein [Steroidobacteraceae bacterium]